MVKIRMKRMGMKKEPFYRIVVTDSRNARDNRSVGLTAYSLLVKNEELS